MKKKVFAKTDKGTLRFLYLSFLIAFKVYVVTFL